MAGLTHLWTDGDNWVVPEGWRQGRGAWGGLVAGQILTSATSRLPEAALTPRSVHVAMLGPVMAGQVGIEVQVLRAGTATYAQEVTLRDADGELLTRATVISGRPRVPGPASERAMDIAPVPPKGSERPWPLGPPVAPEFLGQLRFTPVTGLPYAGADELTTSGWVGLAEDATDELTPAVVAAMADAWWTAALVGQALPAPGEPPEPVSTLDFTLYFPQEPPTSSPAEVWATGLWHDGRVVVGRQGYLTEERVLRAPTGEILAVNSQIVAVGRSGASRNWA